MRNLIGLAITLPGLLLCSCSQISLREAAGNPCVGVDWWELGRTDGASGYPATRLDEQIKKCSAYSVKVDSDLYLNGREAGLIDYCTPTQGLELGRNASPYNAVCPPNLEPAFRTAFERGEKIRDLEQENASLDQKLSSIKRSTSSVNSVSSNRQSGAQEAEQLRQRRARNDNEIMNLETSEESNL